MIKVIQFYMKKCKTTGGTEMKEKITTEVLTDFAKYLVKTKKADDLYCSVNDVVTEYISTNKPSPKQ